MEINEYLIKSFELMRTLENIDFFAGVTNLSRTEFHLLREVILDSEKGKHIISSEIARRLGITRSAVSQIVTKMEQRGIVNRVASPTDRKIAYICLSEQSMAVFEEQCKRANETMQRIVDIYGEDKIKTFFAEYDELRKVVDQVMKEREKEREAERDGSGK